MLYIHFISSGHVPNKRLDRKNEENELVIPTFVYYITLKYYYVLIVVLELCCPSIAGPDLFKFRLFVVGWNHKTVSYYLLHIDEYVTWYSLFSILVHQTPMRCEYGLNSMFAVHATNYGRMRTIVHRNKTIDFSGCVVVLRPPRQSRHDLHWDPTHPRSVAGLAHVAWAIGTLPSRTMDRTCDNESCRDIQYF